jgi:hypothetical protein
MDHLKWPVGMRLCQTGDHDWMKDMMKQPAIIAAAAVLPVSFAATVQTDAPAGPGWIGLRRSFSLSLPVSHGRQVSWKAAFALSEAPGL